MFKICKNLFKKAKKQYFKSVSSKDVAGNKQFWNAVKPFFRYGYISINDKNIIIDHEVILVELFSTSFTNAVENTTGKASTSSGDYSNYPNDTDNVTKIISEYKNHLCVNKLLKEAFKKL